MELTQSGFYKTPRIIKGLDFLPFVRDILKRGNEIYVKFMTNQDIEMVLDFTRLYDTGHDNSVLFQIRNRPREDILLEDISQFEFIQYRPDTAWVAIHVGSTKRIGLEDFDKLFISETFRNLKPLTFIFEGKFWHVMGLELTAEEEGPFWYIYLKRQESNFMTRIPMPQTQKFLYNPQSDAWSLDDGTEEYTDNEKIKYFLRQPDVHEIIVAGVPMTITRAQFIAGEILFMVFVDGDGNKRYYYATQSTKLRIVTDQNTLKKEYRLDHVKAMRID